MHYIYGVSASQKGFNTIALKKLESIPSAFSFKHLVDYNLGSIALENSAFSKAISHYNSALNSNMIKSNHKLKILYHNIGICYLHLKKYNESELFLLKELDIAQKTKDTLSTIYAKLDLGNLFYQQYKDDKAIPYFEQAYAHAQLFSNARAKQNTAQNMAVVEKNRNRYKESVRYYTEYIRWKDSLWNRDKISALLEKDKQIAIANKEKEIFVQKEISEKQKERIQFFVICFVVVLLFSGILLYLYRIKTKQHSIINMQKQELEELNNTKNYLFSVISHDLRSPVTTLIKQQRTLKNQIDKKDFLQAESTSKSSLTIVESLSHLLNNVLHWSLEQNEQLLFNRGEYALKPIVEQVLIDFDGLANANNIKIIKVLDETILAYIDQESLKIVLRNVLDNALKYTDENGNIEVIMKTISDSKCCIDCRFRERYFRRTIG